MAREVQVNTLVTDQFPVFEADGITKVSGLTNPPDFAVVIWKDGVVQAAYSYTIAEIGSSGEYKFTFTPDDVAYWEAEVTISAYDEIWQGRYDVSYVAGAVHFEDGAVWVNEWLGGNDANPGTAELPVATLTQARTIAIANNLRRIRIVTCAQSLTADFTQFTFIADDLTGALAYIDLNNQSQFSVNFIGGILLSGTQGGTYSIIGCWRSGLFAPMSNLAGGFQDTYILATPGDKISLQPGVATTFFRCGNASGGGSVYGPVEFVCSGTNSNIQFSQWTGDMCIEGMNHAGSIVRVDGLAGEVEVDSSCTLGTVIVSGHINLVNNTGGATVIDISTYTAARRASALSYDNIVVDNTVYDSDNQMTASRTRVFSNADDVDNATDGGTPGGGDPTPVDEWEHETEWEGLNKAKIIKQKRTST
jgi:hypothetical protein